MPAQILTLHLDGITAADYLAWCADPEPVATDRLRRVEVDADPLGDVVAVTLEWGVAVPPVDVALAAAGLRLTADVRRVTATLSAAPAEPCLRRAA